MKPQYIAANDPRFPECLRVIPDPPAGIYVLGNLSALHKPYRVAIIGSRRPTTYGRTVTQQLAQQVSSLGIAVVSGLALGIDAVAHQSCLEQRSTAIAVLASGIDQITPATNYQLGLQILKQNGVIISEYPPGSSVHKLQFIARNRLVAGLSQALLITEAAAKSGTIHTANFALEQGKPVLVVPGNITSTQSAGTNALLKAGAFPVTDIRDIAFALGMPPPSRSRKALQGATAGETALLRLIQQGIHKTADLLIRSQLDPAAFSRSLTALEITGQIRAAGGSEWTLSI